MKKGTEINLFELRREKGGLEEQLRMVISKSLAEFEDRTGWSVKDIYAHFVSVRTHADPLSRNKLSHVVVDLEDI